MKKFLLLLTLVLTGCFRYTWADSNSAVPKEDPVPVIIARGTDGDIDWTCHLEDLNSSLVWVPCEFHNRSVAWSMTSACINVSFYDNGNLVVQSQKICSGQMMYNENKTNYAAFTKEKRATLRKCGELLDLCVMLATPTNPPPMQLVP